MKKVILYLTLLLAIPLIASAQSSIKVQSLGNGKPILFLPGFATPGEVWNETTTELPEFQSLMVTYAGFGDVQPVEFPWYEKLKTDLIDYISEQNLQDLTIVGHSMGGNLALELASTLPSQVKKVLIVDALACMRELMMPGVPAEALGYDSPYNDQLLAMDKDAQESYLVQMSQGMISSPDNQGKLMEWMSKADRKTFIFGYVDLLKLDSRPLLPEIKAKVMIMVADQPFGATALENMKKQYKGLENKEFLLAKDSKHYIMLDQTEWFIDQLKLFLNK
tara:strand:- start:65 stop:898 length:834 start_codon:yes stop_codon:yes gene_type:complete